MATKITDGASLVKVLKIDAFSTTSSMGNDDGIRSRWIVGGYEWEVCVYPARTASTPDSKTWVALQLTFLSEARTPVVRANLCCQLMHPISMQSYSGEIKKSGVFSHPNDSTLFVYLASAKYLGDHSSGCLKGDTLAVKCTITVLEELPVPTFLEKEVPMLSSNLHQNLGELLQSEMGADITFLVCGESFAAHKSILAARSPVFKAEFFGEMKEKLSRRVEVEGMEAAVFKAMLHFIYTDTTPELDQGALAQRLLAAADRYALDRLKMICGNKLSAVLTVDTVASTLVLAERHNCLQLKASCVEFIVSTPAVLDAVLATEGYKDLVTACPSMLSDLLKAVRGRKN